MKYKKNLDKDITPFTPAVSLVLGLNVAVKMIMDEGLENTIARHAKLAEATRKGCEALGLKLFAPPEGRGNAVTPVWVPEGVDGKKIVSILKNKYGITIAGGQDDYAGKIFRVGHLGYFGEFDIITTLAGLEMTLAELGYTFERGAGIKAAESVFMGGMRRMKVLVAEKIGDSGIELLKKEFSVDVITGMTPDELIATIPAYDALIVRSATKVTRAVIEAGRNLKIIGRAGVGVDNIDVTAATERGVIVCNAPTSNIVSAAEHTIALMLAQARNIPQANASMHAHKWERSKFTGTEVYEKTLGIVGFGRVGTLVAERARGLGMKVIAYDPYTTSERAAQLGIGYADTLEALLPHADFLTVHLPKKPEAQPKKIEVAHKTPSQVN